MSEPRVWTDHRRNGLNWITGDPDIGEDCWIGPFTVLDGAYGLSIGDRCSIGAGAQVYSHQMVRPGRSAGEIKAAETVIGDDVYVGANAVICAGATVGSGATVAAGAVVTAGETVPRGEAWGGVPAQQIRGQEVLADE